MLAALIGAAGCRAGTFKDPNDVAQAGILTPNVIQEQLEIASDELNARKAVGEIGDRRFHALMAQIARDYIAQAKDKTVNEGNAALWGEIFITARDWPQAEAAFELARKADFAQRTRDYVALGRYDTDILRLARVKAELGKVEEAVTLTRSIFDVTPKAKAPILPAVVYEIVPAGAGKGHDQELAELLKDAVAQHQQVLIDPNTDAGRDFLLARPHHIHRAWEMAADLYLNAGKPELAQAALDQAKEAAASTVRL